MNTTSNPEIAALWNALEQIEKGIAEIRASLNRLNKIVRASIRQAVWQSIALFISLCVTIVGGLAYQTGVLNNRFEQIEKGWRNPTRGLPNAVNCRRRTSKPTSSNLREIGPHGSAISNRKSVLGANNLGRSKTED